MVAIFIMKRLQLERIKAAFMQAYHNGRNPD
jgi:hypothetical protein